MSNIIQIDRELLSITISNSSISEYCNKIKSLADRREVSLTPIDHPSSQSARTIESSNNTSNLVVVVILEVVMVVVVTTIMVETITMVVLITTMVAIFPFNRNNDINVVEEEHGHMGSF